MTTNATIAQPYATAFDPFGFSHGEADVHYSDSETVGYGWTTPKAFQDDPKQIGGFSGGVNADGTAGPVDQTKNATPDVTANDYGVYWSPGPGSPGPGDQKVMNDSVSGLPMSRTDSPLQRAQAGKPAGGKAKAIDAGSPDVLADYKSVLPQKILQPGPVIQSTAPQQETATPTTYAGQLTTDTGAKASMGSMQTLIIVGGVMLLVGLFFHSKG